MLSVSPDLLELNSDFIECLGDNSDEDILNHPGKEEDHGDKVEGGLPWIQRVGRPVHDVDPALLAGSLVDGEDAGGELPEPGEADLGPVSVRQVHALEALPATLTVAVFVVEVGVDPATKVQTFLCFSFYLQ